LPICLQRKRGKNDLVNTIFLLLLHLKWFGFFAITFLPIQPKQESGRVKGQPN